MLQQVLALPALLLDLATSNLVATVVLVLVVSIAASTLHAMFAPLPPPIEYKPDRCGDITAVALRFVCSELINSIHCPDTEAKMPSKSYRRRLPQPVMYD